MSYPARVAVGRTSSYPESLPPDWMFLAGSGVRVASLITCTARPHTYTKQVTNEVL